MTTTIPVVPFLSMYTFIKVKKENILQERMHYCYKIVGHIINILSQYGHKQHAL